MIMGMEIRPAGGGLSANSDSILILPWESPTAVAGTWARNSDANSIYGDELSNIATHADGDKIRFSAWINAGTYIVGCVARQGNNAGIAKIDIGGTTAHTVDMYSATLATSKDSSTSGFVVAAGATVNVDWYASGKNGASSNYFLPLNYIYLRRSA